MKQNLNLQDVFLNRVRKDNVRITLFLTNGNKIEGLVTGFDNFTIILKTDNGQQLIYKHSISIITPSRKIELN